MSETAEEESCPRVMVTSYWDALEYDAAYHLHRGESPELIQGTLQQPTVTIPRVLPWRSYLQVQGKRIGTAGAGWALIIVGFSLLWAGMFCISRDVAVYMDCQPQSNPNVPNVAFRTVPPAYVPQPVGNLPYPEDLPSTEEGTTKSKPLPVNWELWTLLHLTLFPLAMYGCIRLANSYIRIAMETEAVVPLTSANTGHLPAAESLVRASEQTVPNSPSVLLRPARSQSQPEEMLRPAAYSEEKLPEQLVRPVGAQE